MGAKNLVMLKTHIESINICFLNDFVYGNILWALSSLRVFFFNSVLYSFGLILRYIFRFQVVHQSDRNGIQDSEIDGLTEELANLLFTSSEYFHVADDRERETESSVLGETNVSDVPEDSKIGGGGKTESFVSMETDSNIHNHEDSKEGEGEEEYHDSKEKGSDNHEDSKEIEAEKEGFFSLETFSNVHEDVKKTDENETECSVFMEGEFNVRQDDEKRVGEEKEETEGVVIMDTDSSITTSKYQFVSGKDMSVFMEEPSTLTFSLLDFYEAPNVSSVSDNAFASTGNIVNKEVSEGLAPQEEKESVQEQRSFSSNFTSVRFRLECEAEVFGGNDSDSDDLFYNDNLSTTDSESESSNNSCEGFEYTSVREKDCSNHGEETCIDDLERTEETKWEDNSDEHEMDSDEEDEYGYEWEHDEVVEQLRLELRNARQGGLATIFEEEEEEEAEEKESPKVVEDLKPLKIEEKLEYKDHIVGIHKVYKCYAEKMRKLDILNYQTMHAIGLLQLKDPLKLILLPKSTVQGAKPLFSHNLWPRKASKQISDPMMKFVHELHRDLELVYVGQVCFSWEILCWQHKKSQELQQYDSQRQRRYNLVAGDFQLFQVLMQRFTENEPFQGPRIDNYAKNRCVIRNLLQVPIIKDDNMKDKKITKWSTDEDAIASGRLEEIIKESMRVFYEFVRADKASQHIVSDVKDPEISDLVVDVRTQLHKKERKLKDIVGSGNCIVRRFQKHHEDQVQLDHEQLLAHVGLRLISRVLNMKKLRKDQLIWCNEKLNRIKFVGRKIQVEHSFLLFPC